MPQVQEADFDSELSLIESCRTQSIEDKMLVLTDEGYKLTAKGNKFVSKELARYELRPGMLLLIQQRILEMNEVQVW